MFKPQEWALLRVGATSLSKLADYMTLVTQRYQNLYYTFPLLDEYRIVSDIEALKTKVRLIFILNCLV